MCYGRACALVIMIAIFLGVGMQPTPGATRSEAIAEQQPQLVGNWEKISRSACGEMYPDDIQFQENGLYFGHKDPPGTFTQWDVGTYEIVGSDRINLSTANDAIITYDFVISNGILTFVDFADCHVRYRRVT
jgi:hypothetical protein